MEHHSLARRLYVRLTIVVTVSFAIFISVMLVDFSFQAINIKRESLLGLTQRIAQTPEDYALTGEASDGRIPIVGVTLRRPDGDVLILPDRWAIDAVPSSPLTYGDYDIEIGRDVHTGADLLAVAVEIDGVSLGLPGQTVILQVARPTTDMVPIIRTYFQASFDEMWWIFALILVVTLAVVRFTVGRSMRAVQVASEQAAAIAPHDIDRRLPLDGLPREIEPLARRVNDALDRLERGFRAERAFTAAAAHELRTPLSVLRARIEAIPASEPRQHALEKVDDMARLVGQLLQLARIETWQGRPEDKAEAVEVCRSVATELSVQVVAAGGDIELRSTGVGESWFVDRILFEVVVRNLIENAIRHGGDSPRIRITIDRERLVVEDDGPGIAGEHRDSVFKAFWRHDNSGGEGAGIGLTLVARIAERLGARVRITQSDLGGARVAVYGTDSGNHDGSSKQPRSLFRGQLEPLGESSL